MSSGKIFQTLCGLAAIVGMTVVSASAQTADRRTFFTFNRPISFPGVALPAGKYLFRIVNPNISDDVTQVLSADGKTSYAMLFTIPDERTQPASRPEITFLETGKGQPSAIKAWWYPGQSTGYEFIYSKKEARLLAKNVTEPILTTHEETVKEAELKTATPKRLTSSGQEVAAEHAPAEPTGPKQEGTVAGAEIVIPPTQAPVSAQARAELPKTASNVPLVGLLGLLALGAYGGLRLWRIVAA